MDIQIKDFKSVHKAALKSKADAEKAVKYQIPYKGLDAFVFNLWLTKYLEKEHVGLQDPLALPAILKSKLDYDSVYSLLHDKILSQLVSIPPKLQQNGDMTVSYEQFASKVRQFLDQTVDESNLSPEQQIEIQFQPFLNAVHNFYYEQLMLEAQEDADLEQLLWGQCAIEPGLASFMSASDGVVEVEPVPANLAQLFTDLNPRVPVKE